MVAASGLRIRCSGTGLAVATPMRSAEAYRALGRGRWAQYAPSSKGVSEELISDWRTCE
ncbi:hypothetical protein YW3DRAFT_07360 [Streptomyces sp. MnatMP-M77]|nr:hypothetical protein YW3DRAFT_07360 [Streptomyces sp. MnatMP-M77]